MGSVAQMVRVGDSYIPGRRFDSYQSHRIFILKIFIILKLTFGEVAEWSIAIDC